MIRINEIRKSLKMDKHIDGASSGPDVFSSCFIFWLVSLLVFCFGLSVFFR